VGIIGLLWANVGKKLSPGRAWEGESQKAVKNEHFYVIQSVEIRSKKFTKVLLF
jgi:hypothetical protein